ncbi:hypothetical protein SanaruYs_36960 [Chryseotalea sanaruensis]|uniref:STAS/SEC14 domain-containing protein n=1 Tax=Chryseotalea sanaruensis TaxID=2482724 RepID=A0A401UF02_9BACT|nr:hypothetical protein [Chryseotalea sanaruensis]GCC53452.1 hypothetical protein SanaruYs_36960 [Chryseotalea sanaruensis]
MKRDIISLKNVKGVQYVTIYYDTILSATVDEWVGDFETKENFISGLYIVLTNIQKNKSKKWLADLTKIEGDFSFMKDHILQFIIPQAKSAGLLYEALVLPYNIFSILSVQTAMEEVDGIEIHLFSSVQEAGIWLNAKI